MGTANYICDYKHLDMKKEYSIWISGTSLLLSVIAVCVAAWRSPELSFDYQGVIVGVLSLLVTALIGWQIYNSIEINRKVNGTEDMARRITNEAMEKYGHSVKSFVLTLHTLPLYMANNVEYAIDNYMGAIKEGLEGSATDGILLPFGYMKEIKERNKTGKVLSGKKNEYISLLSRIDVEGKTDMIRYIMDSVEVSRD